MYDIAIIGAGPAGSTLARLLGKQHKVLLVDKGDPTLPSDGDLSAKCCGGLLAPDAQKMLAKMGLAGVTNAWSCSGYNDWEWFLSIKLLKD